MGIMRFVAFWWRNLIEGWHGGDWAIAWLEGILLAATIWLHLRQAPKRHQTFIEGLKSQWTWKLFLWAFVVSTIFIAPFIQWDDADNARDKAQNALYDKSPKFDGFIDQTITWDEPGKTNGMIVLEVSVNNYGGSPSIAESYQLHAILTNHVSVLAKPIDVAESFSWNALKSNTLTIYKLKRSDLISEKTSVAIQPGNAARGWLVYELPGISFGNKPPTNGSLLLSFLDVGGKAFYVTNGFRQGTEATNDEAEEIPRTLPGSRNLVETNIQLSTAIDTANWQPPELEPGCTNVSIIFGNQVLNYLRWEAEMPPDNSVGQVPISDIPESAMTNLEKMPHYSPRLKSIFLKASTIRTFFGDKPVAYPFGPFIVSNRLYLYVQMPFVAGLKRLIMNDTFDSALPDLWDRNYGTNRYVYEIVNEKKAPVLQVFYRNPHEIYINGIFIVSTNSILKAFYDAPQLITIRYGMIDLGTKQAITNASLNDILITSTQTNSFGGVITNTFYDIPFPMQSAIFKYPSGRDNNGVFAF